MNKDNIQSEVEALLEAISEQYNQVRNHQGKIPQIELDIILANIAKLYEQFLFLKKKNQNDAVKKEIAISEITEPENTENQIPETLKKIMENEPPLVTLQQEKGPIVSFVVRPSFMAEESKPAEPVTEPKKEIAEVPVVFTENKVTKNETEIKKEAKNVIMAEQDQEQPVEQEVKQVPATPRRTTVQSIGLFDGVGTVASQYQEQPTLHDKFSKNKTDSSLGRKLQNKPVEDLKKSIGINEKFSFINELFEGDLNNYNKAIDTLNQSSSLDEAMRFLNEQLLTKYAWNIGGKSFQSLSDLIERRFMK